MICEIKVEDNQLTLEFNTPVEKQYYNKLFELLITKYRDSLRSLVMQDNKSLKVFANDDCNFCNTKGNISFQPYDNYAIITNKMTGENINVTYSDIADVEGISNFFEFIKLCESYNEDYNDWICNYYSRMENEKTAFINTLPETEDISKIPDYKPSKKLKPYSQLKKVYFDIETTGLDTQNDKIIMIGLLDDNNNTTILNGEEKEILKDFNKYLQYVKPDVLIGHNIFNFDLPFIYNRCLYHGINPQFEPGHNQKINNTTFHGQPIEIQVFKSPINFVDTWTLLAMYDFSARKLKSYNLKNSVIELGLRENRRLELSSEEIQQKHKDGDLNTIQEYLKYDLEDTRLLTEFLLPNQYYQLQFIPNINLQQCCLMGNANKWERIIESHYQNKPLADQKVSFEGGLNVANPGLYRNCHKIDVSSLYPSIMLNYRICSKKDTKQISLQILKYLTQERLRLKKLAKTGDKEADHTQASMKILINSLYGFLATQGMPFNDFQSASRVTEIGREILKLMINVIEINGGQTVEADTDGVIFTGGDANKIFSEVQNHLPAGINIEYEFYNADAVFVIGRKNYLVVHDIEKQEYTLKGKLSNRERIQLEKDFYIGYVTAMIESYEKAEEYYNDVANKIMTGKLDKSKITINRVIRKREKTLVNAGLGQHGDKVSYYMGIGAKPTFQGDYDPVYYLKYLEKIKREIDNKILKKESEDIPRRDWEKNDINNISLLF